MVFIMKKIQFLFVSILLSYTSVFAAVDVTEAFRNAFKKTLDVKLVVGLAVAAIVIIAIFVIIEVMHTEKRRRREARINWRAFYDQANERKLNASEVKLLEDMVQTSEVKNPEGVFQSAAFFEELIDNIIAERAQDRDDVIYDQLRALREKLGYASLAMEVPYVASRQFQAGERLLWENHEQNHSGQGAVEWVRESDWFVDGEFFGVEKGEYLKMKLTRRGDAEYSFETRILEKSEVGVRLEHVRSLQRNQLRRFVRVDVSLNCRVRIMYIDGQDVPAGGYPEVYNGRLLDLSAGGVSLRMPMKVAVGSHLILDFDLPGAPFRDTEVKVVRTAPMEGRDDYQLSVAFIELDNQQQEKIVQYAHRKQLEELQWR
jgi:c-di-GMP-binding flagellar brake protein YcgR